MKRYLTSSRRQARSLSSPHVTTMKQRLAPAYVQLCQWPGRSRVTAALLLLALLLPALFYSGARFVHWRPAPTISASPALASAPSNATPASEHMQRLARAEQVPDGLRRDDWNSIRSAYEKQRHAVFPVAGGQQARNPGQQWLTRFDGRGFAVTPDQGDWSWGLELESYGFAAQPRAISGSAQVTTQAQRVAYQWDDALEE